MSTSIRTNPFVNALPAASPAADARPTEGEHLDLAHEHISLGMKITNLLAVIIPFAGFVVAAVFLWGRGLDWLHLGLMLGMYVLTCFGITIGFHRLFTHRAFKANKVLSAVLAVLGSMAVEGPVLKWVATHRRHHQHSDHDDDPHSPHLHGHGFVGMLQGLWHSHVGWLFHGEAAGLERYVADLRKSKSLRVINTLFPLWVVLGMAIPAVLGGLLSMSWMGALLGFLWGGLARIFLVHHVTWSINSVCHLWGTKPFQSHDESRNNLIFGVLAFGEGWHNNHHAFPTSAKHGLRWWEIDLSYQMIRLLSVVGLAWDLKVPDAARMESKRVKPAAPPPA